MNKQKGFQKRLRAFLEPFFMGGDIFKLCRKLCRHH